jgi:hypothetical protein
MMIKRRRTHREEASNSRLCPIDPTHETCETFFLIWSHRAVNLADQLIEFTIRQLQQERLQALFQTRNEWTIGSSIKPMCPIRHHRIDGELRHISEHLRHFCLTTRNLFRHLRSDARLFPNMSIDLDQKITMKICRFIVKIKVFSRILAKQFAAQTIIATLHTHETINKIFVALQSNFELLFGNTVERNLFQNARTGDLSSIANAVVA